MNPVHNFSSVKGKIQYLLMEFNTTRMEKPLQRLRAMMRVMPGIKFVLWCSRPDVQEVLCAFLEANGIPHTTQPYDAPQIDESAGCTVVYEQFASFNPWIRDAFLPLHLQEKRCRLLDTVDEDARDQGWAKRMEKMRFSSGLTFEVLGVSDDRAQNMAVAGGDVLIDGKWVFLGKKSAILESLLREHLPAAELIVLEEKAGVPELYHIDLFLTLTGLTRNEQYTVLVARCEALDELAVEKTARMNACLDQIAGRLETSHGLEVIRNPVPVNEHVFAYNNCVLENAGEQKTVWIPAYSFDASDSAAIAEFERRNEAIWHRLGFETRLVEAPFGDLLGVQAGLHCITNEVRS